MNQSSFIPLTQDAPCASLREGGALAPGRGRGLELVKPNHETPIEL